MARKTEKTTEEDEVVIEFDGSDGDDPLETTKKAPKSQKKADPDDDIEIEEEDDTPEADRGRDPMPEDIVKELEEDELEEYSDKVKLRLKQFKKLWHDERRAKEKEQREGREAVTLAQKLIEENRKFKADFAKGEKTLLESYKYAAERDMENARREYKEAYDEGDTEKVVAAQEKLNAAAFRKMQLDDYTPSLQTQTEDVEKQKQEVAPTPDAKTMAWQERNTWYGTDPEMTASALGLHQKLITERGPQYAGTDDYWQTIDSTMGRRFPEYFGDKTTKQESSGEPARSKASPVAPASRSRAPKKITLRKSQLDLARRLGITPEQYAKEFAKLDS